MVYCICKEIVHNMKLHCVDGQASYHWKRGIILPLYKAKIADMSAATIEPSPSFLLGKVYSHVLLARIK